MENTLFTILARGGSKGIPGKNIRMIGSKPLIFYSISLATNFLKLYTDNSSLILSTDSAEIKDVVRGMQFSDIDLSYSRPEKLAADDAGKIEAISDVLKFKEKKEKKTFDYVIDLDVTSPLRTLEDLKKAFELLVKNRNALNIFSVNDANRNPYFNMVEENKEGYCNLVKKGQFLTRQSAPRVFDMNASFYIYRREFFRKNLVSAITDRSLFYKMDHICFDLDHPIDFEFMDYLIRNDKLTFKFS